MSSLFDKNENIDDVFSEKQLETYSHLAAIWRQFIDAYIALDLDKIKEILERDDVLTDDISKDQFMKKIDRQLDLFGFSLDHDEVKVTIRSCACHHQSKRTAVFSQRNCEGQFGFLPEFKRSKKLSITCCSWFTSYGNRDDDPMFERV